MIKTKSKLKKYLHNRKLVVISSLLLGITMLTLFLVNAYYYQILPPILTPISINKIMEEDPSTAKTSIEKKIIDRVNKAAQKESRYKTDSTAHQDAVKELYIAGTMLHVVRVEPNGEKLDDLDKIEEAAVIKLKGTNALTSGSVLDEKGNLQATANLPIIPSKSDSVLDENGNLQATANLPTNSSDSKQSSGSSSCVQGTFGCPYDFAWGDDKAQGCKISISGYYCWKDANGDAQFRVINLPSTLIQADIYFANSAANVAKHFTKDQIYNVLNINDNTDTKIIDKRLEDFFKAFRVYDPARATIMSDLGINNSSSASSTSTLEETDAAKVARLQADKIKILSTSYNAATNNDGLAKCQTAAATIKGKCIPVQGGGYVVVEENSNITSISYNTGASAGRPTSLDKYYQSAAECKKMGLSPAEICEEKITIGTSGSQTKYYIVAKDTEERKEFLKYEFRTPAPAQPATPITPVCNCDPGYKCQVSRGIPGCVYDPSSTVNIKPSKNSLLPGDSCAKGSNSSCSSGDCRKTADLSGKVGWFCMAESTFTDNIVDSSTNKIIKKKNTFLCQNNNECASDYCSSNYILGLWEGYRECRNNPFILVSEIKPSNDSNDDEPVKLPKSKAEQRVENLQSKYEQIIFKNPDAFNHIETTMKDCEKTYPNQCIPVPGKKGRAVRDKGILDKAEEFKIELPETE